MAKLSRSIEIEAPVEKVFDFATDVGKFWTSWPEEVAVRDVELKPDGVGSSARLFTHFLAIHMEGTIEYTTTGRVVAFRAVWSTNDDNSIVRQRMEEFDVATASWQLWFDGFYRRISGS